MVCIILLQNVVNVLVKNARISWTQVETGSAITWKYPSCILAGDSAIGEFYSIALTSNKQQADTGTKMIHISPNTKVELYQKEFQPANQITAIVD